MPVQSYMQPLPTVSEAQPTIILSQVNTSQNITAHSPQSIPTQQSAPAQHKPLRSTSGTLYTMACASVAYQIGSETSAAHPSQHSYTRKIQQKISSTQSELSSRSAPAMLARHRQGSQFHLQACARASSPAELSTRSSPQRKALRFSH
jgi:hypothetical protein